MSSTNATAAPAAAIDDYTPEEHLTSIVMEYRKLEAVNQNSVERMYSSFSSPFKIGNKPCEAARADALGCLSEVIGGFRSKNVVGREDVHADSSESLRAERDFPPVHRCHESVLAYETCILEKSLPKHNSLVASFEARRSQEAEMPSRDGAVAATSST
ncbi:unnamed protein product [Trypanosoma congolense IL3000]|uniref:WGS project CAEQ00000000 data, annotated contig 1422 n=1 Tax=Trypanosoma congolense (strain IL3000) TaxID=1068625 RepID=F9W645_TRYCI|nr:unnamed protein product [Trypanosoma congolense IL3000]